jgi:hypothetical protein
MRRSLVFLHEKEQPELTTQERQKPIGNTRRDREQSLLPVAVYGAASSPVDSKNPVKLLVSPWYL